MSPPGCKGKILPEAARHSQPEARPIIKCWQFWGILALALLVRLLWADLFQNFIGADAIRYLWISQHVSRGDWHLLPQLYTSPLLPALTGLLARITQDNLLAGQIVGILSNTLAAGLAMVWIRRLFPERPALAWLTGLGLALNHVWSRTAPFVLTDNLFYLWLIGLLWLMTLLLERVTWMTAMAFGLVWGLFFLSREIGLYCGAWVFMVLAAGLLWKQKKQHTGFQEFRLFTVASLTVMALILLLWGAWFYHSFGIFSLGEGRRFYTVSTQQFDRESRHPYYQNGSMSFFQLRPYELMEFTRFPKPDDGRYPPSGAFTLLHKPLVTFRIVGDNFIWSFKEFQRVTLAGSLTLFFLVPVGLLSRRLSLPTEVYWTFGASAGMLGLHFLGPVREARLIGWFFPWLYLGLAGLSLWLWQLVQNRTWTSARKKSATILLGGFFLFPLVFPQYVKEVPKRWRLRQNPQVHLLAGEKILERDGPGAIIASREPEVAFRSQGYWISLPHGTAPQTVSWLYLGGADYLLLHDLAPIPEEEKIFWADPQTLQEHYPELKVMADFRIAAPSAFGKNGRLFRFRPQAAKLASYREQFPWAGTHPKTTGAWAPAQPEQSGVAK